MPSRKTCHQCPWKHDKYINKQAKEKNKETNKQNNEKSKDKTPKFLKNFVHYEQSNQKVNPNCVSGWLRTPGDGHVTSVDYSLHCVNICHL